MRTIAHKPGLFREALSLCLPEASSVSDTGVPGLPPTPSLTNPMVGVIPYALPDTEQNQILVSTRETGSLHQPYFLTLALSPRGKPKFFFTDSAASHVCK